MAMSARPEDNVSKAVAKVREAAGLGAEVVCLPELYRTPYFCQKEDHANFELAEPVPGPSTEALVARREGRRRGGRRPDLRAAGARAVPQQRGHPRRGRKGRRPLPQDAHPRRPALLREVLLHAGDLGFQAFDKPGRIGTLICWDQWYPEAARLTALRGAAVLFYPTAIGWHPSEKAEHGAAQRAAWQTIQRAHAIANGVYVAVVNRVGHEIPAEGGDGLEFWGTSFVADPFGVVIAEASTDREEILVAEVDLPRIEQVRTHWPFLRDRRIDAYAGIDRRFLDRE